MENRLFNFNFVDRKNERKIISDFIEQKTNSNILWINGSSGVGKSFLIENTFLLDKTCKSIFISPQAQDQDCNALELILKQIQDTTKINFIKFVKNNYSSISDIAKKVIKIILEYNNIDLDWFFDIAFDSSKLFVSKNNEKQNTSKLVQHYIDNVLEYNKLIIILDNFTYCDFNSQQILTDLLTTYMNSNQIQFVISTTHEKLEKQPFIKKTLLEKLETEYIYLSGFNNEQYFKLILENKFVMTPELYELISYIYKLCKGIPESLKEVLRNLALSNLIKHKDSGGKSDIDIDGLKSYLLSCDLNKLPKINFTLINDIESFFLQVVTYIKYPVSYAVLEKILNHLCRAIFLLENSEKTLSCITLINKYIGIDVLQCTKNNDVLFISFKHDLLYWKLNEHFQNYVNKEQIFYYLFQYVCEHQEFLKENGIYYDKFQEMLAYYSYQADNNEWIELNYRLGKEKYDLSLFYEAMKLFRRLTPKLQSVSNVQKLNIAKCCYDVGEYTECILVLKLINCNALNRKEKYEFYFTWGKALFVKLNASEAIEKFDLSMKYVTQNDEEYYNLLAMKITALAESPGGTIKAKEVFESDVKHLIKNPSISNLLGNILRNCWAYCTGDEAIQYLNIALTIAQGNGNDIEAASTYNNLGLEYIRKWELQKAYSAYNQAIKLLDSTKKHEISYPLNNLAVYEMLNKRYQTALDYLLEANLWNRAPFMDKVIKTHLLMCNYYLNNIERSKLYADELYEYIFHNSIQDENIIRKTSLNLCIYYKKMKMPEKAKECINLAYKYISKSSCEYKGTILYNEIMGENNLVDTRLCASPFFEVMDFEPWLTTFSHE